MNSHPVFLHVDLDAFYASVEQRDKPDLRGKPVVVGGSESGRGVVSACSYEARVYGIHSAMPAAEAKRRAPHALFLPVRMQRYQEVSRAIMELLADYTPSLQQISVDEAFLDMTGTRRLLGDPAEVARAIRGSVRDRFGLTASVGVGPSRFIAKMASDFDKPDGMHVVPPGGEQDFVLGLELRDLWGLGKKTRSRLEALGIRRVDQLRDEPVERLRGYFGPAAGAFLYKVARGIDPGIFQGPAKSHSISTETTFARDIDSAFTLESVLLDLCEQVMYRRYHEKAQARTVTLKLRNSDFRTMTVRHTLPSPVGSTDELFAAAKHLLHERWDGGALRLLGVGLGNVEPQGAAAQGELFAGATDVSDSGRVTGEAGDSAGSGGNGPGSVNDTERRRRLEQAVFSLRDRGVDIRKARGGSSSDCSDDNGKSRSS